MPTSPTWEGAHGKEPGGRDSSPRSRVSHAGIQLKASASVADQRNIYVSKLLVGTGETELGSMHLRYSGNYEHHPSDAGGGRRREGPGV